MAIKNAKKNLGIGLDVLLTATSGQQKTSLKSILTRVQTLFGQALEHDEIGDSYEAYYLYRQVIDLLNTGEQDTPEVSELISRTYNNLAIILFESGQTEKAVSYLQLAIDIYPPNRTAIENMKLIRE